MATMKYLQVHINESEFREETRSSRINFWRGRIFKLLHDPSSSSYAFWMHIFFLFNIIASSVAFMLSSLPVYWKLDDYNNLYYIEAVTITVFTLEYILSVLTAPRWYRWIIEPLSIIDLVAIFPFYFEIFDDSVRISTLAVLRCVRLVRMVWLLKFADFSSSLSMIGQTFKRSGEAMLMLSFLLSITTAVYSSLIFFAEQTVSTFVDDKWIYANGRETPFQSIFQSMYWCIITLTTVGYGDAVPESSLGKVVATFAAVTGVIVLAFPVTVLGVNIVAVRDERKARHEEAEWRSKLSRASLIGLSEVSALTNLQEEYAKLCSDITSLEGTLESMRVRRERLTILLDFLKESCIGKIATPPQGLSFDYTNISLRAPTSF